VFVPAKLVPFFKASNELKARVNDSESPVAPDVGIETDAGLS
jgi:hypothetical protein